MSRKRIVEEEAVNQVPLSLYILIIVFKLAIYKRALVATYK